MKDWKYIRRVYKLIFIRCRIKMFIIASDYCCPNNVINSILINDFTMIVIFVIRLINSSVIQLFEAALKLSLGWDAEVLLNPVSWKYSLERAEFLSNMSLNLCATYVNAKYTITPRIYSLCRAELYLVHISYQIFPIV